LQATGNAILLHFEVDTHSISVLSNNIKVTSPIVHNVNDTSQWFSNLLNFLLLIGQLNVLAMLKICIQQTLGLNLIKTINHL
jgi:hypothetical protein